MKKFMAWLKWIIKYLKPSESKALTVYDPPVPVRRKVDTDTIRVRLQKLGWILRELPIQRYNKTTKKRTVSQWKIIAFKNSRSVEATGNTIDEAMSRVGQMLGVIPLEVAKKA
jgi:hypothetical protein